MDLPIVNIFYKWNHIRGQGPVSALHYLLLPNDVSFDGQTTFYLLISWWIFQLFSLFGYYIAMNIHVQIFAGHKNYLILNIVLLHIKIYAKYVFTLKNLDIKNFKCEGYNSGYWHSIFILQYNLYASYLSLAGFQNSFSAEDEPSKWSRFDNLYSSATFLRRVSLLCLTTSQP